MKPVLQVLGAMLIHADFREAMKADIQMALSTKGYSLTPAELEVMERIVDSFQNGDMDDAVDNVRNECPNWPCNDPALQA